MSGHFESPMLLVERAKKHTQDLKQNDVPVLGGQPAIEMFEQLCGIIESIVSDIRVMGSPERV